MAILTGINTRLRGSIGDYTFARVNGQTVASQKVEKKSVPVRSRSQMLVRMQLANLAHLYQSFKGNLRLGFEGKAMQVSDYNEFIRTNFNANQVYLTKSQVAQGGCVVAAYQLTRGSLSVVNVEFGAGDVPESDIALGSLSLGSSTTLKAFSEAVLQNNPGWQQGDQLSVFIARQTVDAATGVPRVEITSIEVTLDVEADTTMLGDLIDITLFGVVDGCLALAGPVNGAVAIVHSRKTKNGTLVSSQFFVVSNSYLAQFQSAAAFEAAVKSYGGLTQDEFLTPNVDSIVAPNV